MQAEELFITGLKNAHAMERQAQEILERQIDRMEDYPDVHAHLREHLEETKQQLSRLEQCLDQFDESPSTIKDTAMAFGANIAAMGHAMAGDEVLKNMFANNALENYEVAAYKSLLALADEADADAKSVLEQSLEEEERMADWVAENIEKVTQEFLEREEAATA
jgi:ferritin-like metal-binding protein YciE